MTMKRINSLKSMTNISNLYPRTFRTPANAPCPRHCSTKSSDSSPRPETDDKDRVDLPQTSTGNMHYTDRVSGSNTHNVEVASPFRPTLEHDDAHSGPYGVEAPPCWSYMVTVTEIHVEIKIDSGDDDQTIKSKEVGHVPNRLPASDNEPGSRMKLQLRRPEYKLFVQVLPLNLLAPDTSIRHV
ncbi:hypothetical protein P153DRAFT_358627 [Dothidotthia symphoricarpi CBS 119687]|uniref:Uncharacterized protein n=1 Tax=Dothidotthia symphoricarpi CBS 119687 TaxID=1392245 RepID=A0A6A6A7F4_9PLEO|nr:uncharacterized protein P153DRAFT_358627 [Dothidotthia symphoricarpi CBS 119687]KAF2127789.1 hypothetical protein P153DRAFT_358627 [Dothidotthia symphoricarpi CBS 119687]